MSAAGPSQPTELELARAAAARVLPDKPTKLSNAVLRLQQALPSQALARSYAEQQYFLVRDRRWLLRPSLALQVDACRWSLPVHLVSAWSPNGVGSTLRECLTAQQRLRDAVRELGATVVEQAAASPADQCWYEGTLLVRGLDDYTAQALALEHGQAATVRWDADALTVIPTGLRSEIRASRSAWTLAPLTGRSCPMRRDDDPTGRCVPHGGPFGSTAIHAAALWGAHRRLAMRLLGCDPCRDGAEPAWGRWGRGTARSLSDEVLGSRYGSWTWRQ